MFIREIKKRIKKDNKEYDYLQHRLVESIRTANGPRQRTLLNLGTLTIPKDKYKDLANAIEAIVNKQMMLFDDDDPQITGLAQHFAQVILNKRLQEKVNNVQEQEPQDSTSHYETIDVNTTTTNNNRTIGLEHIVLSQLKQLNFFDILDECSFSDKQKQYAAAQVCARLVHPDSERETARWLRDSSAMGELLDADFSRISDNTLHSTADLLYANKEHLEKRLSQKTSNLFSLHDSLIFYDLTNSYFESPKRTSKIARYGHSKEKRNDCPLVSLALVVDEYGFPKHSHIYKGNVTEGDTLFEILEQLSNSNELHSPQTVIIDAGIATEDNIKRLRADKRFEYVAVSRKKLDRELFADCLPIELTVSNNQKLTIKTLVQEDEAFLLCASEQRAAKEEAIFSSRRQKFESGLSKMQEGLHKKGTRKKYGYINERIGRLKEKYKVGSFYTIDIKESEGKAIDIQWQFLNNKPKTPGEYILRTSRTDLEPKQISSLHRTLTMIESSFRWMKMELGLRPNYHQKDGRMSSHIFISVLAYFVLAPILNKLGFGGHFTGVKLALDRQKNYNIPYGLKGLADVMASQTRVTTSFLCKDQKRMDVRTTVDANAKQLDIYHRLNVNSRPLKRIVIKHV